MDKEKYNKAIKKTEKAYKNWCRKNEIPLHGIHYVITWEEWDNGIGVYFFLNTISDVNNLNNDQIEIMKSKYLEILKKFNYPFDKFPNVLIKIDSDENVKRNYNGSYFLRLR